MQRVLLVAIVGACALSTSVGARAEGSVGTLTLDELSFVSFQDHTVLLIPAKSTLRFTFGEPVSDGSVPFTIAPDDVSIGTMSIPEGTFRYELAGTASGTLRSGGDGQLILEFVAAVSAGLEGADAPGTVNVYSVPFTTEQAVAKSAGATVEIDVAGSRVVPGPNYVQIVGVSTDKENSLVEPGAAVYSVLSGTFDRLPTLTPEVQSDQP